MLALEWLPVVMGARKLAMAKSSWAARAAHGGFAIIGALQETMTTEHTPSKTSEPDFPGAEPSAPNTPKDCPKLTAPAKPERGGRPPASTTTTIAGKVLEPILASAGKAGAKLSSMGIDKCKIELAIKACANRRADKIVAQATAYAEKLAREDAIAPGQLVDEIAREVGVNLWKSPRRKKDKTQPKTP